MQTKATIYRTLLTIHVLGFASATLLAQGSLTPPGPPAPSMKTLDQLEPRMRISQPGSFPILITQPGSYYVAGNITGVANTHGVRINVGGVTIDLNGFEMVGSGSIGDRIDAPAAISNLTIRNGVVRGWGDGD